MKCFCNEYEESLIGSKKMLLIGGYPYLASPVASIKGAIGVACHQSHLACTYDIQIM
jgi:hypothetical protein